MGLGGAAEELRGLAGSKGRWWGDGHGQVAWPLMGGLLTPPCPRLSAPSRTAPSLTCVPKRSTRALQSWGPSHMCTSPGEVGLPIFQLCKNIPPLRPPVWAHVCASEPCSGPGLRFPGNDNGSKHGVKTKGWRQSRGMQRRTALSLRLKSLASAACLPRAVCSWSCMSQPWPRLVALGDGTSAYGSHSLPCMAHRDMVHGAAQCTAQRRSSVVSAGCSWASSRRDLKSRLPFRRRASPLPLLVATSSPAPRTAQAKLQLFASLSWKR